MESLGSYIPLQRENKQQNYENRPFVCLKTDGDILNLNIETKLQSKIEIIELRGSRLRFFEYVWIRVKTIQTENSKWNTILWITTRKKFI